MSSCTNCGKTTRGRFCSHCGAITESAGCAACDGALEPGDRHCAQCGESAAGAGGGRGRGGHRTPWIVAGVAFAALILVVLIQRASELRRAQTPAVADVASVQAGAPAPGGAPSMAEIEAMPKRELMNRLYNRIMLLHEAGKADSVRFFAPMALSLAQHPDLQPPDADLRFDVGSVALAAGEAELARAQADTILRQEPTHLLGLALAAEAARARGDSTTARGFDRRLLAAATAERARNRPEYEQHAGVVDGALRRARQE